MNKYLIRIIAMSMVVGIITAFSSCGTTQPPDEATFNSNFIVEVDLSSVEYPEVAPVIYAEKLTWEFDELRAVFGIDSISGLNITDDCVREGAADILRADKDGYSLALINFLDGKFGDINRKPVGHVQFSYSPLSSSDSIANSFVQVTNYNDTYDNSLLAEYRSERDLPQIGYAETVEKFQALFRSLGLDGEAMPYVDISYCLSREDQLNFFENGPEDLVPYYINSETGERELPYETQEGITDAIVLGWRQSFCGIPVNGGQWGARFGVGTLEIPSVGAQEINSYIMADGSCQVTASNLFVPVSYGEERQICSPYVAVDHLNKTLGVILDDTDYYLVRVELSYAIFEDGDNYVLYPYWLLFTEPEYVVAGELARGSSLGDLYAYDGYTGEMVISVENPLN